MKYLASLIFVIASATQAAEVNLAWDANPPGNNVAFYNIRTGIQSGSPTQSVNVGNVTAYTVAGLTLGTTYYFTATAVNFAGLESGPSNEVVYTPALPAPDKLRYYPRASFMSRMNGGIFEGTNGDPVAGPYTVIYTIPVTPPLAWTEVEVSLGNYRYLRYRGKDGTYCNVAEIEFWRGGSKLTGVGFGTAGSYGNNGNTFDKALDGDINTRFDAPTANGGFVGIDTQ